MIKTFPKDCTHDCENFSTFDLSIDDLVGVCRLLKLECDLCDRDFSFIQCPLEKKEGKT